MSLMSFIQILCLSFIVVLVICLNYVTRKPLSPEEKIELDEWRQKYGM
jgi:hypothetical protein